MRQHLMKITDGDVTVLNWNEEVALCHSQLLLYARYVCLRVFLQCVAEINGEITEGHKEHWLLVQLAPMTLVTEDIFISFTNLAGGASSEYLVPAIQKEHRTIKNLLLPRSTLFCMLNEVQALTKNLNYFQSFADPTKSRPILHPIVAAWSHMLPNLIVLGTGISMEEVETDIGSAVAKEGGHQQERVTYIGGFNDEDGQRAYLKWYLPPGFLDTSEGEELTSQVGYWLRGQFVFNAAA